MNSVKIRKKADRSKSVKTRLLALGIVLLVVIIFVAFISSSAKNNLLRIMYPKPYHEIVSENAKIFELDENLVYAVIHAESKFDDDAKSHAGALGLMQLTTETFDWINGKYDFGESVDILNPYDNVRAGCALLKLLTTLYGDMDVVLSAYNAGIGNVGKWLENVEYSDNGKTLKVIPFPETSEYVKKVKQNYQTYKKLY